MSGAVSEGSATHTESLAPAPEAESGAGSRPRLGPVTLLRELFRGFEEALDRRELVVLSPDGVDCEHRAGWSQVDELDAAGELLDQRADDEADAAAFGDVAPDGRAGSVLVDLGLEARGVARRDDRVVVAGRHFVRPQLQRLVTDARQVDLLVVGEVMVLPDGDAHHLAPDRPLTDVFGIRRQRREGEIAAAVAQEGGDVAAEHLAGVDLQPRVVAVEPIKEEGHGLEGADERVDEAQRPDLAARCGLHTAGGAVGTREHTAAIGEKYRSLGREPDASGTALEERNAE